jgi:hypothetical protein
MLSSSVFVNHTTVQCITCSKKRTRLKTLHFADFTSRTDEPPIQCFMVGNVNKCAVQCHLVPSLLESVCVRHRTDHALRKSLSVRRAAVKINEALPHSFYGRMFFVLFLNKPQNAFRCFFVALPPFYVFKHKQLSRLETYSKTNRARKIYAFNFQEGIGQAHSISAHTMPQLNHFHLLISNLNIRDA